MALSQHRRREEIESLKKEEEQQKIDDAERKKKQERVSNCPKFTFLVESNSAGFVGIAS